MALRRYKSLQEIEAPAPGLWRLLTTAREFSEMNRPLAQKQGPLSREALVSDQGLPAGSLSLVLDVPDRLDLPARSLTWDDSIPNSTKTYTVQVQIRDTKAKPDLPQ